MSVLRYYIFHVAICLLVLHWPGFAQTYIFEHLSMQNGLSSNRVRAVLQDKEGFYWIATSDGLNRFDGTSFKIFRNNKSDPHSLSHNSCLSLEEDEEGNIWVGTFYGISVYNKRKGYFENLILEKAGIKADVLNRIWAVTRGNDGSIWISATGIWKYDSKTKKLSSFFYDSREISAFSENPQISYLTFDKINNGLWFSTDKEIYFFDIKTGQFFHSGNNPGKWNVFRKQLPSFISLDTQNRLWIIREGQLSFFDAAKNQLGETDLKTLGYVRQLAVDKSNRIWISRHPQTSLVYDPATGSTDSLLFKSAHSKSALTNHFDHITVDHAGNYWISSSRGISIFNPSNQFYDLHELSFPGYTAETSPFVINSAIPGSTQKVWLATSHGLFLYDPGIRTYEHIRHPLLNRSLYGYFLEGDSILWAGYYNTLLKVDLVRKTVLSSIKVGKVMSFVIPGTANDLWVGHWDDGIYRVTRNGKLLEHYSMQAGEGSLPYNMTVCGNKINEEIWVGLNEGFGFVKYDSAHGRFIHFNPSPGVNRIAAYGTVTAIASAGAGHFMIGTHGGGVYLWNQARNIYEHFDRGDGLNGNFINSVLADQQGNYWISSSNGLSFFNTQAKKIIPVDIDLGFHTDAYLENGKSGTDRSLLFSSRNKLVIIWPEKFSKNKSATRVLLSSFKVFDKDQSGLLSDSVIRLSYKKNFFSIEFSARKVNPVAPIQYAYILEGFDKDWNYPGNRNYATYTDVPGGKYLFRVKSISNSGEQSGAETILRIQITPPFWKTGWFYTIAVALFLLVLGLIYRYRVRHLKKMLTLRLKISQDLHDEVGSALSSIHIYSSVAAKAMDTEKEKAIQALQNINENTRLVMENMNDIVWAIHSGNLGESSLEVKLKNYGYELLNPLNIHCDYAIDKETESKLVNVNARKNLLLIAKEAMNNIAKHSSAAKAAISLKLKNKKLVLEITDDGKGMENEGRRRGYGITNMQQRTEALSGEFSCISKPGRGTRILCSFSLTSFRE